MFALPGSGAGDSLEQQVYLATFNTIRHIAEQGPCVIIGRCADYALADNPNHAEPVYQRTPGGPYRRAWPSGRTSRRRRPASLILKTDKRRASYCEYYSSKKWGACGQLRLLPRFQRIWAWAGTVELIQAMVAHKEHPIPSPTEIDPTQTEA